MNTSNYVNIDSEPSSLFTQTFPDMVVTFKSRPTPARVKKAKPDLDLGVKPLESSVQETLDYKTVTDIPKLLCVASTITRPTTSTAMMWEAASQGVTEGAQNENGDKFRRDINYSLVSTQINMETCTGPGTHYPISLITRDRITGAGACLYTALPGDVANPNMDVLNTNPVIQRLVEERVSLLEARMKTEFGQGNNINRRKSRRYNTTDTPCAPSFRIWPNESCPTGATRKRTAYDDLTLGQFVIGFLTNIIDTSNAEMSRHMSTELLDTVKLSENLSWPITLGAFAVAMHKVEDETVTWADTRFLAENGLTYSQTAVFNGSITFSPKLPQMNAASSVKRVVYCWFNEGTCPHLQAIII